MAFTHTITRGWASPTGTTINSSVSQTDEGEINFDFTIANATTDQLLPVAFDSARIKSVYMLSTKAITIETNNATTPDDTISLVADKAFTWVSGDPGTAPFTVDVAGFYVTNASGASATVKIRILHDLTP